MQGSQLINLTPNYRGRDLSAPEFSRLGVCKFRRAIQTHDSWESHASTEIVMMLEGEVCWEHGDSQLLLLNGGQAGVFPAGTRHRVMDGVYPPSKMLWLILTPEGEYPGSGLLAKGDFHEFNGAVGRWETPVDMDEALCRDARLLAARLHDPGMLTGSKLSMADARARLASTTVAFWNVCSGNFKPHAKSELVMRGERLMRENLENVLSIDRMAKELNCSRSNLHLQIRRELGMSPVDYRQRLQVRFCCERLRNSNEPIKDIAEKAGFTNQQYFARVFKKYMDATPSAYRLRNSAAKKEETRGESHGESGTA